jgi:hypothetical protein
MITNKSVIVDIGRAECGNPWCWPCHSSTSRLVNRNLQTFVDILAQEISDPCAFNIDKALSVSTMAIGD